MSNDAGADAGQRAAEERVRDAWSSPGHPSDKSLVDLGPDSSPAHRGLCTQHGIVPLNDSTPNGCLECDAIRAKAGGGPEALQRWAAEVGIPPDAPLVVLVDPEPMLVALYGHFMKGYRIELLGVAVPGIPERREPMPVYGSPLGTVQVWARRAVHEASGVVSEVRWHPEREQRGSIHGTRMATLSADMRIALQGFDVMGEVVEAEADAETDLSDSGANGSPIGRPEGSGEWPEERFKLELPNFYERRLLDQRSRPTQEETATDMGIKLDTFRWYRRTYYEMPWRHVRDLVEAMLASRGGKVSEVLSHLPNT